MAKTSLTTRSESKGRWKAYTSYWQDPQCMLAQSLQSCPTLWDPMDCSLPGLSGHGILQARILEWVAIPSLKGIFPTQESNPVSWGSYTSGGFFTDWATGEAQDPHYYSVIAWLQQGGKLATNLQSNRNCNFHKTKCQTLNIPCVCICISMYVCMYFVIYICTIIYTKPVLHTHIFQGTIYFLSNNL